MIEKANSLIGKLVLVPMNGTKMYAYCIVKDFKNVYGIDRVQVTPLEGEGEAWVQNFIVKKEE